MFVFSFFSSSGQRAIEIDQAQFTVHQSDEVYFRNIRLSSYRSELDSASGFDLLTLKSLQPEAKFSFVIVKNWRQRMAYIMPDRQSSFDEIQIGDHIARKLKDMDMEYNWETAVQFYNAARIGEEIMIRSDSIEHSLTDQELKSLKITIKDYLKLTHSLP